MNTTIRTSPSLPLSKTVNTWALLWRKMQMVWFALNVYPSINLGSFRYESMNVDVVLDGFNYFAKFMRFRGARRSKLETVLPEFSFGCSNGPQLRDFEKNHSCTLDCVVKWFLCRKIVSSRSTYFGIKRWWTQCRRTFRLSYRNCRPPHPLMLWWLVLVQQIQSKVIHDFPGGVLCHESDGLDSSGIGALRVELDFLRQLDRYRCGRTPILEWKGGSTIGLSIRIDAFLNGFLIRSLWFGGRIKDQRLPRSCLSIQHDASGFGFHGEVVDADSQQHQSHGSFGDIHSHCGGIGDRSIGAICF